MAYFEQADRTTAGLRLADLIFERERLTRQRRLASRTRIYEPVILLGFTFIIGFFAPAVLCAAIWLGAGGSTGILMHWPFRLLLLATVISAATVAVRIVRDIRRERRKQMAELEGQLEEVEHRICAVSLENQFAGAEGDSPAASSPGP
jgi:membrane protein implicated in regulation of membrane protease activity